MDQSYPLKSYAAHHSSEIDYGNSPSSPWQNSGISPVFSVPRRAVSSGYEGARPHYEPLTDAYTPYESSPPHEHGSHGRLSYLLWWLPELLASLIAIGCLFGIIAVLRAYDKRSLAEIKLPGSLTLNGIVAAISTVARVALMVPVASALSQESWIWFANNARQDRQVRSRLIDLDLSDNASRGAWGSLLFIFLARRRWVAYIGALATIISLGLGTSTQQLLSIGQYPITDPSSNLAPGSVPRAETWQYYNVVPSEEALTPPLELRAAMYSGIMSAKIDPIVVNCPSGNCTWPITSSLAICGECSQSSYVQQCDNKVCNYTMPSGSNITLVNTGDWGTGFVVNSHTGGATYNASAGDKLYLTNFEVIGAPYKSLAQSFHNVDTLASECALWMCVQSYTTSMTAGKLEQEVTMSFSDLVVPTTKVSGVFDNYTFASLPSEMNPSSDVVYNVSVIGRASFALYGYFNGTAFLNIEGSSASNDITDAIWNASSNLDPWIKKVAESMTNALRYDDPNPTPPTRASWWTPAPRRAIYNGTGFQLGVKVQWRWLILPVACVLLSILFLVIVMVKTAYSQVPPWKGSMLTSLFMEVDQELKLRVAGRMNRWRGVITAVGTSKGVLREESAGRWAFKNA